MEPISGKKIFILYPDEHLRKSIFYGSLRNSFTIYFIYDYEKIKSLAEYYPGSIIVLNLLKNDLNWLPAELSSELLGLPFETQPKIIVIYDDEKPSSDCCTRSIQYLGDDEDLKAELNSVFIDFGGKGRRNFVRYGGSGENVASIKLKTSTGGMQGIVHDISASGLSCSIAGLNDLPSGKLTSIILKLDKKTLELDATKVLTREFDGSIVHVLKFNENLPEESTADLLGFIYKSLDSGMNEFIKNLSN